MGSAPPAGFETRPIAQHGPRVVLHHKPLVRHQPGAARHGAERAHAVRLLVHLQREERGELWGCACVGGGALSPVRDASEAHLEDLLSERLVRALRQPALLVEQREEADRRRRRAAGARL